MPQRNGVGRGYFFVVRAGFRPVGAPGQTKLWGPQYNAFYGSDKAQFRSK